MELLGLYMKMLRDPSVPTHRVVRKAAVVAVGLVGLLAYYRHAVLGFGFGEAALVTLGLSLLTLVIAGIFGGALAGSFYESFLRAVGAREDQPTIAVFFAEWLFALTAPLLGALLYFFLGSRGEGP